MANELVAGAVLIGLNKVSFSPENPVMTFDKLQGQENFKKGGKERNIHK